MQRKKGKTEKLSTFNTQLIDLGIEINDGISEIYEVKTNFDRQSIYTGIGQLFFHSVDDSKIIKNLVLPRVEGNGSFQKIFAGLNVKIIMYELDSELKVSFYE